MIDSQKGAGGARSLETCPVHLGLGATADIELEARAIFITAGDGTQHRPR